MLGVTFVDDKLISFDLFCSDAKIGLNMVGDFIRFDTLFLVNLSIHMTSWVCINAFFRTIIPFNILKFRILTFC